MAVSGDTVVVGAPGDDIGATFGQGSAYVFVKPVGGWATTSTFNAKLTDSNGVASGSFGASVAVSGDTVVVGAENASSAYVFVKPAGGWSGPLTETAQLTASDGAAGEDFRRLRGGERGHRSGRKFCRQRPRLGVCVCQASRGLEQACD